MNTFLKHCKTSPEIIPVVGMVAAGVVLSGTYISKLLLNHNDIYINQTIPVKERFDRECPRIVTVDRINNINKLPFIQVVTVKNPYSQK